MCAQISHPFGTTRRRKILLALQPPVQAALTLTSAVPDIFSRIACLQTLHLPPSPKYQFLSFLLKNARKRLNRCNEPSFSRSSSQVNIDERRLINARRHSCIMHTYYIFGRRKVTESIYDMTQRFCTRAGMRGSTGRHKARHPRRHGLQASLYGPFASFSHLHKVCLIQVITLIPTRREGRDDRREAGQLGTIAQVRSKRLFLTSCVPLCPYVHVYVTFSYPGKRKARS